VTGTKRLLKEVEEEEEDGGAATSSNRPSDGISSNRVLFGSRMSEKKRKDIRDM